MHGKAAIALVVLLAAAAPVWAQGTAGTPDPSTTARSAGQASAPASGFSIDQKGVKRETAAAAGTKTVDAKSVKKTGDPLPDVDVSYKRPASQRMAAPGAEDKANKAARKDGAQGAAGGTLK